MKMNSREKVFFLCVGGLTALSCFLICGMIDFGESHFLLAVFWLLGFTILTFNVSYMLVCTFISFFLKPDILAERNIANIPKTAIIYVVRNESEDVIRKSLEGSFRNNFLDQVNLWLLSNSDDPAYIEMEKRVIHEFQTMFGLDRVGYFQTYENSLRRKHVCIQQWLKAFPEYRYFLVCDADSILPQDGLIRLIRKAEHPANREIALFQSQINIGERPTYFARLMGHGQDICQRIFARANQKVFGRGVSYGSGSLIRCAEFRDIEVPEWALSHDIWDTLALEEKGYRVAFCSDVITLGSYPANYLEYLKRGQRWIRGTLESFSACRTAKVSAGTRFMAVYPIYMYSVQPLFLLWILSGFFYNANTWESLLVTQKYSFLGGALFDMEMGSHLVMTMTVVSGHRFFKCKNWKELRMSIAELLTSILLCLNNILFDSFVVLKCFLKPERGAPWVAMKKGRPQNLSLREAAKRLWPATLIGVVGWILGLIYNPLWLLAASPFLLSFLLGIPMTYLTSGKAQDSFQRL
jgi:membrane glycosyltransferase